jgi:pyrrolidone-carboxylate peptidase
VIHLGVAAGAPRVRIERCAYNLADFRVKDVRGYAPRNTLIESAVGNLLLDPVEAGGPAVATPATTAAATADDVRSTWQHDDEDGGVPRASVGVAAGAASAGAVPDRDEPRFTEIDVDGVIDDARAAGIPDAELSDSTDPGRYICNYTFYHSLRLCDRRDVPRRALFVHFPSEKTMPIERQIEIACAVIQSIAARELQLAGTV